METTTSFIYFIEESIKANWNLDALTDYKGATLQYRDIARKIEKIHILFQDAGIKEGDKIAICGRNTSHWVVGFLATITYGAVIVPILHEFKADQIHNIVNHSESKLLLVGDKIWENLDEDCMPQLTGIIGLQDYGLIISRSELLTNARERLNEKFGTKYPSRFEKKDICYRKEQSPEELVIINYTSGTTGYSKGVMLPYRSILSNILYCREMIDIKAGDNIVSMLPLGHVFGMVFDFLFGIVQGAHLWFLTRMPSPKIIVESFAQIRPRLICSVPLVIEKIIKKDILQKVDNRVGKLLLKTPLLKNHLKENICKQAIEIFGGNFSQIIIGGAPFNAEVEKFLRSIGFPYTMAYGMTECGPIISHEHWTRVALRSCGKVASRMEVKALSPNPSEIPGELVCRGENLMLGYYKNEEATRETIDAEGWLHTGDMAVIDKEGNIFIKGRCKNILLTGAGQNIYPEEVEAKLNNYPFVAESLVVLQNDKLIALVYVDKNELYERNIKENDIAGIMEKIRLELNKELPPYSQITRIHLHHEEFQKTAKKSIKRYLYQTDILEH